ncbi:MAG TPA: helix-turn-helix domain-containing protein [Bacteroidia bacterium]|nr:helix-turn-helix domain-containing protein [Bacteroidia bacterium]
MNQPTFDTWTTIFLFAAIQGIFVSVVLLFIKKENRFNNSLISLIILLFSITLIEYVLYWTHYQLYFPHVISISAAFPFLTGVILWYYFRNIFEKKRISLNDFVHLLPFLIYVIYLLPVYLSSAEVKQEWILGNHVKPSLFVWPPIFRQFNKFWPWITIVHMFAYAGFIFKKYHRLSIANKEVAVWFRWLMGLFVLYILSYTSYFVLVNFDFFNNQWDYMISFSMMFFIYFIAWFGYLQPQVFSGFSLKEAMTTPQRYKNSALTEDMSQELADRLKSLMINEKLYRESDLRLDKLADKMGVSRHNLSQVINEQMNMNFFEYLNYLRIEESCHLLTSRSGNDLTISEIAFGVGFNNKVSFYTMFKKVTGKTPTDFRKEAFKESESY